MTNIDHNFTDAAEVEQFFNDAEILGVETPAYRALLDKPATLMTGEMWGAKDRRNTQDGEWNSVTMPWSAWIIGDPGTKNTPAWGFSRHPVGKDKAGACIVLGSSIGRARKAKAMETMFAMGIDIDAGFPLNDMLDKLEKLGLFCLVYTSHSHGKRGLQLKHDEVIRKQGIKPADLDLEAVKRFLREHDKNRYEESFVDSITIKALKKQVAAGVVIELSTPPLDKYRLIFPLAAPVKLIDLAGTQAEALEVWENKITGLAREVLDVHFDTSCTDPSRLFYTARHAKDAEDWYCAIVRGDPLRFDSVPEVKKSAYTGERKRAGLNAFEIAGGAADGDRPPECITPSGASLNDWHRQAKDRFNMADMLEDHCPDKIRRAGGEAMGHVHIECPFEHEHSSEGGTATMAINALDAQNGFWTIFCHHDACQGRHKLEFLEEALRQGWFSEDLLSFDSAYMMEAGEEEEEEEDVFELVETFDNSTSDAEVRAAIRAALSANADTATWGRLKEAVAAKTPIGKRDFERMRKGEVQARKRGGKGVSAPKDAMDVKADFDLRCRYVIDRIAAANEEKPQLFQYMEEFATVDPAKGRVRVLDAFGLYPIIADLTTWTKSTGENEVTKVGPPEDVMKYIFNSLPVLASLPEIVGVKTTPFFARDGELVETEGYHAGSKVYLSLAGLEFPRVSGEPTPEEVQEAKQLIVEEALADFPLGGLTRPEIMQALEGGECPALANTLGMILLPFAREMIEGPTPFHVLNKPAPGTGAGFLADVMSIITTGAATPPVTIPTRAEETGKTLTSVLMDSTQIIFFDNINHSVDSAELAAAATAPPEGYRARILGKTQTVLTPIRQTWILTANTLTISAELLRRATLIDLDRKAAEPDKYVPPGGWRHQDVRAWVRENRGELVWACLTLIQKWVTDGKNPAEVRLASFENWAGVIGGILKTAEIGGFLANRAALADMSDGTGDALGVLMQAIADEMSGKDARLYIGKTSSEDYRKGQIGLQDVLNAMDDPPRLDGWGYKERFEGDEVKVEYTNTQKLGIKFKLAAKGTYKVEIDGQTKNVRFDCEQDPHTKKNCYAMKVS